MVSRPQSISEQDLRDLGFGAVVSRESRQRLLNRDGSFNVERRGLGVLASLSPYHLLLTMSWSRFLLLGIAGYLVANAVFATLPTWPAAPMPLSILFLVRCCLRFGATSSSA